MKLNTFLLIILILAIATGCKKFDTLNTDPARPEETTPQYLLSNAEKRAADLMYAPYYNCRIGMHFAQYWTGTDKTAESRYLLSDDGLWSALYTGPLMDLQEIANYYNRHPEERNAHMLAVTEILKAWIFHVLTDVYTNIPYKQALDVNNYPRPEFDKGADIYMSILNSLKQQVDILQNDDSGPVTGDIIADGNTQKWIKIANALRLRIAMRMADVKPQEARVAIEAAAANTLETTDDDAFFPYNNASATNRFPYNEADRPMVEFAVTATLIDYLKELNDPRLAIYARPDVATNMYRGKKYGVAENTPLLDSLSKPGTLVYSPSFKGYIITYAEVMFLKTEAAARGMNVGGDAEGLYNNAVSASMNQWGITDAGTIQTYLENNPYTAGAWKNVIGTQKWLALYMQGIQAWMERLRLDIEKPDGTPLFIPPASGSLDPDVAIVPSRLNYPNATRNTNAANVEKASIDIGGDSKATKNWWDIN